MKNETNRSRRLTTIVVVLLAFFSVGLICVLVLNTRTSSILPSTAPATTNSAAVLMPGLRELLVEGAGPIADVNDASARAVRAANAQSRDAYGVEPFTDSMASAKFDGQLWYWHKRVGYGLGDLEAEVRLAPSGRIDFVNVHLITLEARNHRRMRLNE